MINVADYYLLLVLTLIVTALILLVRAVQLKRKSNRLSAKLLEAHTLLTEAEEELEAAREQYRESLKFKKSLDEAKLTTKLQHPRLVAQHGGEQSEPPERYHYINSLVESGMDAAEISSVMAISNQEAEQLVNLSRLAERKDNATAG